MLTKCLASEWAEHNIRVNAISPGYTKTSMTKSLLEEEEATSDAISLIPMGRFSVASEIAGLAVLLASNASCYTTGTVFNADGGYTIW